MTAFFQCLYAFLGCLGFCIIANIRGKLLFYAPINGSLGFMTYVLFSPLHNDIFQNFIATIIIALYSEVMARVNKNPVTGYLIVGLLPLVPGGGLYYTMKYVIDGNTDMFVVTGLNTLGIAGALAVGILLVSSAVRLFYTVKKSYLKNLAKR
jgi:uncharacterized membrane protein YjjB (DUF3815 family)